MRRETYSCADVAEILRGARDVAAMDWFYRNRHRLIARDKMPAPSSSIGRPRWDKLSMDAWAGRHHPLAPQGRAANDSAPIGAPDGEAAQRAWLQQAYPERRRA
jgi:hypothetical protein